jgi:hypothetical protein
MNHRKECDNCLYGGKDDDHDNYVECRRHAPRVFDGVGTVWPTVYLGDWCGDWETRRD